MHLMGSIIANARRAAGIKQEELAEQLGVTQPTVSLWERGKHLVPRNRADAIAEVLDLSEAERWSLVMGRAPTWGSLLQRAREEAGLSSEGLAEILHLKEDSVKKWESGAALVPLDVVEDLSITLELSPDEIQTVFAGREPTFSIAKLPAYIDGVSIVDYLNQQSADGRTDILREVVERFGDEIERITFDAVDDTED